VRKIPRIAGIAGTVAAAAGLIVPVLMSASPASARPSDGLPDGLLSTPIDITHNNGLRYGEPEIAVNPRDPDNIVYYVMSQQLTFACEAAKDPNCVNDPLTGAAIGESTTPGWISTHVYVTFDRGRTWRDETSNLNSNAIPAPTTVTDSTGTHQVTHDDLISRGDPMVTVTADGTFYAGWDAMHLGTLYLPAGYTFRGVVICPAGTPAPGCPIHGLIDGGIAVSKSTDGGRTWSTPTLTGTGVDRPWMTTDLATGTIYEASSGNIKSAMSSGDPLLPNAAPGVIQDRYVVSSADGVHWTQPAQLGGGGFSGSGGSTISAANGVLSAGFQATSTAACQYFLSDATATAPCAVFETSTDSGGTWTRHAVPGLATATSSILVAADPARRGTYTVAATDASTDEFLVYVTHDSGAHWSGPAVVTDGSASCPAVSVNACKFKPWIAYSPNGTLGLAWRSANVAASAATAAAVRGAARSASATITLMDTTTSDAPPCDPLGCGVVAPGDENDDDPAPIPYTMWAAVSKDAGETWSNPLQVSSTPSADADPSMLTGTDDTSVIAMSNSDVLVGWGQWPHGTDASGLQLNLQAMFAAVKIPAFTHSDNGRNP
jgi:hypothetical protein